MTGSRGTARHVALLLAALTMREALAERSEAMR